MIKHRLRRPSANDVHGRTHWGHRVTVRVRSATKDERQLALLWLAAAVSAIVLRPLWLAAAPHLRSCIFRSLTGVPCPTCGTTRAATAFLQGHVMTAFANSPLATLAGLLFVVGAPIAVIWTTARWPVPSLSNPLPPWVRIAAVGLIAANWLYLILRA